MIIVTLDGVEYPIHQISNKLTNTAIFYAKAQAIGIAVQKGQQINKATKITVEWSDEPSATPDSI
ncbi:MULTISPECIES: hypothetical protein [Nostoc]|uniref:Uncharacterized protein n=1 Tax=Nostoc paludosum FACHB-159 TaxID=2692908 RepID=A0ABR8KJ08_9NOSO|nr:MULTISPECIES: hypothetical protein [Nostoc]MBD2683231.1 hypothetical protein [Nostoc sp. FACHB-857]MBD2739558.1 hypothetical protein [Nostoc paludosum FACHB-159]